MKQDQDGVAQVHGRGGGTRDRLDTWQKSAAIVGRLVVHDGGINWSFGVQVESLV